mmetsp:Transcript_150205/g.482709  ORF Transcript_150205/g.482709 Transcript_150205/m.482709 type:complete len:369 (+) Transcript_150205:249-1355(+)
MDLPCAPEISQALKRRIEHSTFGYTFQPSEMWAAVQTWLLEEHGWQVNEEMFVFCASVVTAVAACLWAFTSPDDAVLVMTPLYEPLQKAVEGAGRKLKKHELAMSDGRYCLERERLRRDLQGCKVLIFCNPHNPGGRSWAADELRMVAELCKQESVLIVSDEIWSDWHLFGNRHLPIARHASEGQHIVTLMAPTKTWNLAGLHMSYLIIEDAAMRARYLSAIDYAFLHYGGTFASEGMLAAYSLGRPWLHGAKRYVEDQLSHCVAVLREHCSPEVVPLLPEATYLLWLDCTGLRVPNPARFFQEEASVLLSAGSDFGGSTTAHFARLNAAAPRATLDEALARIVAAVKRWRDRRADVQKALEPDVAET